MQCPHCKNDDDSLIESLSPTRARCDVCSLEFRVPPARTLTRHERLQEAADAGIDTWEDYRGER